ncbi:MAG: SpoIIIAH-like family protein [Clostridiales bacterium]|nr:SpoIIIAH-like family protein [Clostridiales bacterium]
MSSKNSKKTVKFRGKQVFVVGLIALVLAAGYYRWTVGAIRSDAVSVSSTAAPSNTESDADKEKDTETFWGGNSDDSNKNESGSDENNSNENNGQGSTQSSVNVISRSRQDRDALRGDTMDKWKEIASNKDASESAKKQAEDNIVKLTKYSENENAIETNVKAKGFEDCFAQVSESGVSVIVKGGNLDSASVAQIKDIIIAETGVAASQIKISSEQ